MLLALAHSAPVHATEAPDISICDDLPYHTNGEDTTGERVKPVALPVDWVAVAASSRNWIAVWTEFSRTYCVETASMRKVSDFERFGKRFLGFKWDNLEGSGYILVDRAGQGDLIDTGSRPHFSPDGSKFASLNRADTGMDGFDGFAIWQINAKAIEPLIVNQGPPLHPRYDWRIDRWEGENCLHISAVSSEWNGGDKAAISNLPRHRFVASSSNDWGINEGTRCHISSNEDDSVTHLNVGERPIKFDWATGIAAFTAAVLNSPLVYSNKDAARCYGRWTRHAEAINDGGFPKEAVEAFIEPLQFTSAVSSADFFLTEEHNHPAARDAMDEAERLLGLAWVGDAAATRSYFENLGLCYSYPEAAGDAPDMATDAPAGQH